MITVFDSLIKLQLLLRNTMGCGAVCGNNSSIYEPNRLSYKIIQQLIPHLTLAKQYISPLQYKRFIKQINQNPLKYRLRVTHKLIPRQDIQPDILTKWKVILYCYDSTNIDFIQCLGYKNKKQKIQHQQKDKENQLINQQDKQNLQNEQLQQQQDYVFDDNDIIYKHDQFSQIQKDIDRTCQLPSTKKPIFQRVLKRITNYFPTMGYTQGINFIIGYLLMIGYSQYDAFWMFVHISINRRYLQLGMLQDNFPISKVYNCIFKNILKRINTRLYQHLYQIVCFHQSAWVFKWFITFFIYSFPFEMIKYVFDIVIQMGGIGMIKLAIAITMELSDILLDGDQQAQIQQFLKSLKNINNFNQHLSINKVLERAYTLQIKRQDFLGIQQFQNNFYAQFILANLKLQQNTSNQVSLKKQQIKNQQGRSKKKVTFNLKQNQNNAASKILSNWYRKLINERQNFIKQRQQQKDINKDKSINHQSENNKRNQRISIQNQLKLLISLQHQSQQIKSPEKDNSINQNSNSINQYKNSVKDSVQIKKQSIPSTGYSYNKKSSRVQNKDNISEIDQLWDEEDRNSNISKNISSKLSQQSRTQNGFNSKIRKISYQDQLDKLASTHCNPLNKSKNPLYSNKNSNIFNQQKSTTIKPKINNFQMPSHNKISSTNKIISSNLSNQISTNQISSMKRLSKGNNLVRAGQSSLVNMSNNQSMRSNNETIKSNVQNQQQSSNSEYSKFSQKQKRTKQNDIYGKNYYKNKSKKQISFTQKQSNQGHSKVSQDINSKASQQVNSKISQQIQKLSHDQHQHNSSSRDSFIDPHNSFYHSNQFIQDDINQNQLQSGSVKAFQSHRQRMNTHQDMLTISLHASHIKQNNSKQVAQSHVSQIQIFQAPQIFKKKNRVSSRISGAQKDILTEAIKIPKINHKLNHTISDADILQKSNKNIKTIKVGIQQNSINYEESYQSIFVPSQGKNSNTFRFHQQMQKCQVQSVK